MIAILGKKIRPKGWSKKLWDSCWDSKKQKVDFTNELWKELRSEKQHRYDRVSKKEYKHAIHYQHWYEKKYAQESYAHNKPQDWPISLWMNCWNKEEEYMDFSVILWKILDWKDQYKYAKSYQEWYANTYNKEIEKELELSGEQTLVMRLIPPGCVQMGSRDKISEYNHRFWVKFWADFFDDDYDQHEHNETIHRVLITKPFYIGKYQITQAQWLETMRNNPSCFKNIGLSAPVENITWNESNAFCKKNNLELPTESQWEYACRAGTTTDYNIGNVRGKIHYESIEDEPRWRKTTLPVGSFANENAWGCYDFHGNVWEWCRDWYILWPISRSDFPDPVVDPVWQPPLEEQWAKNVRGGDWKYACRSAFRRSVRPSESGNKISRFVGFRCVQSIGIDYRK